MTRGRRRDERKDVRAWKEVELNGPDRRAKDYRSVLPSGFKPVEPAKQMREKRQDVEDRLRRFQDMGWVR